MTDIHETARKVEAADRVLRILAAVLATVITVALIITLVVTLSTSRTVLDVLERQDASIETNRVIVEGDAANVEAHRVRNEELHACIVELILAVIQAPPEERASVPNPCPSEDVGLIQEGQ